MNMPDKHFGPIVSGDATKKELRQRSSKLEFMTVKASKMSLVLQKVAIEEKEGWEKHKRNKKSFRLARKKPSDEQLEDELWCIVAKMGFKELSSGRNFRIETKHNPNPRQIDVFAKDDEVALVIECTQSAKPEKKKMSGLIEKISSMKGDLYKAITAYYGREAKIKPKFVIATRNIDWSSADIEKCELEGIAILTDTEIDYYNSLTAHLRTAARYQLLAHLFAGAEIPALAKQVPATRGSMGGVSFYNFLIEPNDLLKISYVGHKASRSVESLATYQRMLQPRRLKAIASYIDSGGKFPTNIVINIKVPRKRKLVFETQNPKDEYTFGKLKLPNRYAVAWILDGRHRLYGYAYRAIQREIPVDKSAVPVLAFENLPAEDEMTMFIDINSKQVKVKSSLLIELYADLHWASPDSVERLLALQARTVSRLNSRKTSPLYDRIVVTGKGKTTYRCLSLTSLSDGLRHSRLIGSVRKTLYYPGPLSHHDPDRLDKSLDKAVDVLSEILKKFADAVPEHWAQGDKHGIGYLCTNIGIRSIILVIQDICTHVAYFKRTDLSTWSTDEVIEEIGRYIQPVVDYFREATTEEIQSFRRQGSSLASVKKQSNGMNAIIQKSFLEYRPEGLEAYITERDQRGHDEAVLMINHIQDRVFHHVVRSLKNKYGQGEDRWWIEGIPTNVRLSCTQEWETKKREGPCETYLYLIHYQDISLANWGELGRNFALGESDVGNRKACVEWVKRLNDIRSKTHHPEKGPLIQEQMEYVKETWKKVQQYFPESTA